MKIEVVVCMGVATLPCTWRMQRAPSSMFGQKTRACLMKKRTCTRKGAHKSRYNNPYRLLVPKAKELTEKVQSVREDLDKTREELQAWTNRVNQLLQVSCNRLFLMVPYLLRIRRLLC